MSNSALFSAKIFRDVLNVTTKCRNFTPRFSRQIKEATSIGLYSSSLKKTSPVCTQSIRSFHTTQSELIRKKANSDSIEQKNESENTEPEEESHKNSFEPFLIIPNPFKVIKNWMTVWEIKNSWDPNFDIDEFKRGAVQAVIRVTELARAREWGELRGLIDASIIDKFRKPQPPLADDGIKILAIDLDNVDLVRIKDIRTQQIVEQKFVDLFVDIIAHKRQEEEQRDVGFLFQLKFHRNYTSGVLPTWTITGMNMIITTRDW